MAYTGLGLQDATRPRRGQSPPGYLQNSRF